LNRAIGWAAEESPSFAIDGLRASAHPIVLESYRLMRNEAIQPESIRAGGFASE